MIRLVHGPFHSQREREDYCLHRLRDKLPCLCKQCEGIPDDRRPTTTPNNMVMARGNENASWQSRSYWIGENMEV